DETTDSSTTATEATTTSTAATTTSTEATTTSTAATTTSTEATTTSTAATTTSDGSGTAAPDATTVSVETTVASDNTATTPSDSTASVTSGSEIFSFNSENPCDSNPCGRGSTCDPRANETYVCLCLPGMAYNNISKSCNNAKVFPGQLSLSDIKYNDKMKDKTSEEFLEASEKISIIPVPIQTRKVESREEPGVSATVDIVFNVDSEITTKDLNDKIEAVGGTFTEGNLCSGACDLDTMTCTSGNGTYTCTCKENYVKTDFSDRVCIGKDTYLVIYVPVVVFFLAWQLALVITGSVLGGLLLIALIVLPIVSVK
uniref:EGF-like domain-containing protein n=1 Tax=Anabas testudineus TaxID=64144 RepID=A0A3Q1JB42_ANATE